MPERADGSTDVYGTPREIMGVIADFDAYPKWVGQLEQVQVLERDGEGRGTVVAFQMSTPLFPASYTLRYDYAPEDRGMSWTYVEGTLEDLSGSYTLDPVDDQLTRVTYRLEVGLDAPLPGLVKRQAAKQIVRSALADLKRRVESG
jgi:ribosome-associated toxin RatA of RatAB toxin-antitoxin module